MKRYTLRQLFNENVAEDVQGGDGNVTDSLPPVDRKMFKNSLKRFHEYSSMFNRDVNEYKRALDEIKYIVESAEQVTIEETKEWFDNITVNRQMKQMKEAYKTFEKTILEASQLSQRLNASYDDIGKVLQNYYDI